MVEREPSEVLDKRLPAGDREDDAALVQDIQVEATTASGPANLGMHRGEAPHLGEVAEQAFNVGRKRVGWHQLLPKGLCPGCRLTAY